MPYRPFRPDMRSMPTPDVYADPEEGTWNRTYIEDSEAYEEYANHHPGEQMYPTKEGMEYFRSVNIESRGSAVNNRIALPLTADQVNWIYELFTGHPKSKSEFRDRTNDMFNQKITKQDHHAAEMLAARLLEEDLLSWDVKGLAHRTYTTI